MVVEVATHDVAQPSSLSVYRLVHAPPHLLFYHPQLRPHAVSPGLPFEQEFARAGFAADEGEAQEVEGLRFAEPSRLAVFRCKASELDEPGLLGMKRQRELLQPRAHLVEEAPGVTLVLEPDNEVVGIAYEDHVAGGLTPSPALGPEIENIVQIDVGQER